MRDEMLFMLSEMQMIYVLTGGHFGEWDRPPACDDVGQAGKCCSAHLFCVRRGKRIKWGSFSFRQNNAYDCARLKQVLLIIFDKSTFNRRGTALALFN